MSSTEIAKAPVEGEIVEPLKATEAATLKKQEAVIDRGIRAFLEAGTALATIREQRLYRGSHGTFEAYCLDRWQLSKSYANQIIGAAAIAAIVPVRNEGQARVLSGLEPEMVKEVYETAQEMAQRPPTAMDLKFARERVEAPKKKEREKQQAAAARKAAKAKAPKPPTEAALAKKARKDAEVESNMVARSLHYAARRLNDVTRNRSLLSDEIAASSLALLESAEADLLASIAATKAALAAPAQAETA